MATTHESTTDNMLIQVIESAIKLPGIKVNRETFLVSIFKDVDPDFRDAILRLGPVEAGVERDVLKKKALALVNDRTLKSTAMSFAAGLPGGVAMAATIPADTVQYFAVALRMAQEIAYLYGEEDLWSEGTLSSDKVMNTLIVYCGVMFGAGGASATLRVVASALGKQALKKIPQMALTKTFYYPIVKSIARFVGVRMTKSIFAKGVSKAVPIAGGIVSGGITFATMKPMGVKLIKALDYAKFAYTDVDLKKDMEEINTTIKKQEADIKELEQEDEKSSIIEEIKEYKELLDSGVITEEEFSEIKSRLIAKL